MLTFFLGLGRPAITDSDEGFYAEAAREMVESGDWLTPHFNYSDRWQKPVLYYWLTAATYLVAGPTELGCAVVVGAVGPRTGAADMGDRPPTQSRSNRAARRGRVACRRDRRHLRRLLRDGPSRAPRSAARVLHYADDLVRAREAAGSLAGAAAGLGFADEGTARPRRFPRSCSSRSGGANAASPTFV